MAGAKEDSHKGSCTECLKLPRKLFEPGSTISHSFYSGDGAIARLQLSAHQGCHFCTLISDALEVGQKGDSEVTIDKNGIALKTVWTTSWPGYWQPKVADYSVLRPNDEHITTPARNSSPDERPGPVLKLSWGNCVAHLRFNIHSDAISKKPGKHVTNWDLYSQTKNFEPAKKHFSPLAAQADSPKVFQLLNSWLDECQKRHRDKCAYVGELVLEHEFSSPTRLLRVGEEGENIVLVLSAGLKRDEGGFGPSYTALSHCWGDPKSVPQTTKTNLVQMIRVGLRHDELSPTFQHAVKIARELNIGWLWIDSLCIVQDDKADKDRELPLMEIIYSMAICTLVASDSKGGSGGCFLPRGPNPDMHVRPCIKTFDDVKTKISVTFQPYLADWAQSVTNGPLFSRGWCFQERQLSKRIIYFTKSQVLWECRASIASEAYPEISSWFTRSEPPFMAPPFRVTWARITDRSMLYNSLERVQPWLDDWLRVVEVYSGKSLSKTEDRLPAIAGVAAHFQRNIRRPDQFLSSYVAGMLFCDLERGLSWKPSFDPGTHRLAKDKGWPPPLRNSATFNAIPETLSEPLSVWLPSWSWISVDGRVRYPYARNSSPKPTEIGMGGMEYLNPKSKNFDDVSVPNTPLEPFFGRTSLKTDFEFGELEWGIIGLTNYAVETVISEKHLIKDSVTVTGIPKCYSMFKQSTNPFKITRRSEPSAGGVIIMDTSPIQLPKTKMYCLRLGNSKSLFNNENLVEIGLVLLETPYKSMAGLSSHWHSRPGPMVQRVGFFEIGMWDKQWIKNARQRAFYII
ncbi:hypothetical protein CNYM01_13990 [Colletotrichum nymphaeae SA-01]|uniref:Heterokaryon incompatibility domain-containing protein n=1 Tax=Colletotrichum nymphaeae SA-01 TaxID=1460502 RepID=A0A135UVQ7_9PEZI|nr:hypothetical protein CNYM01_13990 [Colletotrichum nymphaeae SA-01]